VTCCLSPAVTKMIWRKKFLRSNAFFGTTGIVPAYFEEIHERLQAMKLVGERRMNHSAHYARHEDF